MVDTSGINVYLYDIYVYIRTMLLYHGDIQMADAMSQFFVNCYAGLRTMHLNLAND